VSASSLRTRPTTTPTPNDHTSAKAAQEIVDPFHAGAAPRTVMPGCGIGIWRDRSHLPEMGADPKKFSLAQAIGMTHR